LQDTIRVVSSLVDVIVLRHPQIGAASVAAKYADIPIINAGDGSGEHPSQALLDMCLIHDSFGTFDGLTLTIVGDLKHGRTVHSLVHLLAHYNMKINFVSPPQLSMPYDIVDDMNDLPNVKVITSTHFEEFLPKTDVLYITRIQKERFPDIKEYEKVKDVYSITPEVLQKFNPKGVLMHPLPRNKEIPEQVDDDKRSVYFKAPRYGLCVRMAILAGVFGKL